MTDDGCLFSLSWPGLGHDIQYIKASTAPEHLWVDVRRITVGHIGCNLHVDWV